MVLIAIDLKMEMDLMLGGFKVPYHKSFLAHSDGDIIIHALIDSMFGAVKSW